jgi:hypothetical protein
MKLSKIIGAGIFVLLINYEFCDLAFSQRMAAPVRMPGGWGYIKKDLTWLIEPKFTRFWKDGMFVMTDEESGEVLCEFHDGMAQYRNGSSWGYYNDKGEVAVKAQFADASHFSDSAGAVKKTGKWGFIDRTGNWIIKPVYKEVLSFHDGIAAARENKKWGFIDKSGGWIIEPQYESVKMFSGALAPVQSDGKWGYIDRKNNSVIAPAYRDADPFNNGWALVLTGDGWGYIDSTGQFVIKPQFEKAFPFRGNVARVKKANTWFYIYRNGKATTTYGFMNAEDFSDGAAMVRRDRGNWGYLNEDGTWLLEPRFYVAGNFINGIAKVRMENAEEWNYIDRKGNYLFGNRKFEKAEDFSDSLARIRKDGMWGFINEKGEIVIKPQFERALDFISLE